jgi:amidase
MTDLHFQPAHELAGRIASKEISAVELLEHHLKRIEAHNPALNAIIWLDADRARDAASRVDAAIARGDALGPFAGVPMTLKESFQVAGTPTTWGIPDLAGSATETTALAAERLIDGGAVFVGKTNVPIHLGDWQSFNAIYGTTRNPWNLDMTPGGSSGGSVAALAAGMTALEAGSDIGASIRNPAHYCGVFGLKPTYGLIPPRGQALPGIVAAADISVVGPLTRSARDLELALSVMAGPDLLEDAAWRLELSEPPQKALKDFRVAVKLDDPNSEVDRAYQDKLQVLADALARAGATVSDAARPDIDTRRLHEVYILLLRAATSGRMPDADVERWQKAKAELAPHDNSYVAQMARGNTLSHRDWLVLNNERHAMRFRFAEFFRDWDILLTPAAASAAWPHDQSGERHERTIIVNGHEVPTTDQLFWAGFSGVVYLPSTVGPAGILESGLPVGYQAIAAHLHDRTAIRFAECVEREIGGFVPPPGYD